MEIIIEHIGSDKNALENNLENSSEKSLNHHFEAFLFNTPKHLSLQIPKLSQSQQQSHSQTRLYGFYLSLKGNIQGIFYLFLNDNIAFSPFQAPFGSFEFKKTVGYDALIFWIDAIKKFCIERNISKLHLKNPPFCYAPEQAHILSQVLLNQGFALKNADLCHFLPIQNTIFEQNLHPSTLRRLKKCEKAGFTFQELENPTENDLLTDIYDFVRLCRKRKNFPISMEFERFEAIFKHFPNEHLVFAVKDHQKIIALTVAIKTHKGILYNFYPADNTDYQEFSPTIMLTKGLYEYCQQQGYQILDLGISTENSKPNMGLIRFKRNLGASNCLKLSFEFCFDASVSSNLTF